MFEIAMLALVVAQSPAAATSPTAGQKEALNACTAALAGAAYEVKIAGLMAMPSTEDAADTTVCILEADGHFNTALGGGLPVRVGEPVAALPIQGGLRLLTVLRHNVTRGVGAFQHESPERLEVSIFIEGDDCAAMNGVWRKAFKEIPDLDAWKKTHGYSSSDVLVDEISEGMSREEVEAILGAPEHKGTAAGKTTYFYPKMKVVFTNGKVTGIE